MHSRSIRDQIRSVAHSCPTLCDPMNCSTPGLLVDTSPTPGVHPNPCPSSQWCHPAISSSVVPSPPAPNPSSIRVFSNESTLHMRWPKYWSFSFSIIPSKEIPGLIWSPCSPRDSQESSPTPQFKSINSSVLSLLHSPTLTSIHDHWKNHSLD